MIEFSPPKLGGDRREGWYHYYYMSFIYNDPLNKLLRKNLRNNMTREEQLVWNKLKNSQLGQKFRRQSGIGKYVVDFYCPKKRLIVEIDGSQHMDNMEYDARRTEYFRSSNLKVLRFWNNEVNTNLESVIKVIFENLNNTTP